MSLNLSSISLVMLQDMDSALRQSIANLLDQKDPVESRDARLVAQMVGDGLSCKRYSMARSWWK